MVAKNHLTKGNWQTKDHRYHYPPRHKLKIFSEILPLHTILIKQVVDVNLPMQLHELTLLQKRHFRDANELFRSSRNTPSTSPIQSHAILCWLIYWGPSCSKPGYDNPGLLRNLNSDMESLKGKFSLILFVNNLMIGYSKKNRENCPRKCFWWKEKETRVKI